jgi:hypothetical protein
VLLGLLLIFAPEKAWQRIERANRHPVWILVVSLFPLMVASALAEGYSLIHWGDQGGTVDGKILYPQPLVVQFETFRFVLDVLIVLIGSKLVQWIGSGFTLELPYQQCFRVVAYGITPIFLVRFLDAIPMLPTWICLAIAVFLILHVTYEGIAFILKPSPTKGFGLYLVCAMGLVSLTIMAHGVAYMSLRQKNLWF